MPSRLDHIRHFGQAVGMASAADVLVRRALKVKTPVSKRSGGLSLTIDPMASDLFVAGQVFGAMDYRLDDVRSDGLNRIARAQKAAGSQPVIIDAGANVGYSPLFFAAAYPDAVVFAIEPDPETYRRLAAQCASEPRIICIHAALWKHTDGVQLDNADAASWARTVKDGASTTPSVTLESLLAQIPNAAPLILKMDIEGAERAVFEASPDLVRRFPCLMIEPHDFLNLGAGCLSPLFSALAGAEFDTLVQGENLMFVAADVARTDSTGVTPPAAG